MQRNMVNHQYLPQQREATPCAFLGDRARQVRRRHEDPDDDGFAFCEN